MSYVLDQQRIYFRLWWNRRMSVLAGTTPEFFLLQEQFLRGKLVIVIL